MELKPFDLLLYKGRNKISNIVKSVTESEYSHIGLILSDFHIVEIDFFYCLKINHIGYNGKDFDIYRLRTPLTQEQQKQITEYIYSTLQSKYDFEEILNILLYKFFGKKLDDDKGKFVCSSWINECFKNCGIVLSEKELVTPQDLISDKIYKVN